MIIGVCGYGYSGSGAVFSLLSEFSKVHVYAPNRNDFEFNISYVPDGLEDLEYNLCLNPCKGLRCDIAIYRFLNYVKAYRKSFNRLTNNKFDFYTEEFLNAIISTKWYAYRSFEFERNPRLYFSWKLRNTLSFIFRRFRINLRTFPKRERYLSIYPLDFVEICKNYVSKLVFGSKDHNDVIILNQPFSVNNPENSMKFFPNSKCIIVDRDPRDLFVMAKHIYRTKGAFIPTKDVRSFIVFYKKIRDDRLFKDSPNVLRVRFENLIYSYNKTVSEIINFLGLDIGDHILKMKAFNPGVSIHNTNVFPTFPTEKSNIELIESELKEFLYPFPNESGKIKKSDLNRFTNL